MKGQSALIAGLHYTVWDGLFMISRFIHDKSGNVAMMTALAALLILAGVGAAMDFTRSGNLRSAYQDLADAAVLAAARSRDKDLAPMDAIAKAHIAKLNDTGTTPTVTTQLSEDGKYL
ncbi:MAG: pilus assembly protein TadG-related protein, partial [Pseudomonadota bacterium]